MNSTSKTSRRDFLIRSAAVASALPLVLQDLGRVAHAQDLPKLPLDNAQAKALAYIEDAAKILDSSLVLGRQGSVDKHLLVEDADGYVIATGDFDEPAGAIAYRRHASAARAILPAATAAELGLRGQAADLGDVLEAILEVQA